MALCIQPGRARRLLNILGPFFGLLLVIGLFSLSPTVRPYFLTGANAKVILTQTVVVCALALDKGYSSWQAAALAIGTGAAIGLINGTVIGLLKMMPFIVTLGMMGVGRGTAKWLAGSQTVNPPESPGIINLMAVSEPNRLWPAPIGVWITLALALVMAVVLRRTVFGRYIFAIGANEAASRLSGIRVHLHKTIIYVVAGAF